MTGLRIWDISQRIHVGTPVWPGEQAVSVTRHAQIGDDCPVNIGALSLGLHTGTHGDAPLHYDAGGKASADCGLEPYVGPCVVLDARRSGERVEEADLDWDAFAGSPRILIRTYEHFPHAAWDEDFTAIAPQVIARLAASGVQLIGVDTPSLDPQNSKTMDAHHGVRAADMRILEGLVLDNVEPGKYELIALPLAIAGGDASPLRAILRELPQ